MKKLCSILLSIGILSSFLSVPAQAHDTANNFDFDNDCCYSAAQTYAVDDGEVDPETGFRPDRVYYIRNVRSGLYLTANNGESYNGTNIVQQSYKEQQSQQWHIYKSNDGYYQISPLHAHDMNMGLGYSIDDEGAKINLWTRYTSTDTWSIIKNDNRTDRSYHILSKTSGKAMAILSASYTENAKLVQATYTNDGIRNDEWVFEPVMETEIYYDSAYLTRENLTPDQAASQIGAAFKDLADCFYQKFGIRYQTPKFYLNQTEAERCGTNWDEACPHAEKHKDLVHQRDALLKNLSPRTFRIQLTGHMKGHPLGMAHFIYPVLAGREPNKVMFAHEMTHTFGIAHHDGVGGVDVMNNEGKKDEIIWAMQPNLWCSDCEATIQKNSALYSTYQDTTYLAADSLTVDRNTMDYMITGIPQNTTVDDLRDIFNTTAIYVYDGNGNYIKTTERVATGYTTTRINGYIYMLVVTGDVDGDGAVTIADVQEITRIMNRTEPPTYKDLKIADVNGDGIVSISDVQATIKIMNSNN